MAAAVEFEKSEQEKVDQEDSDANKSFAEVAEEYISDTKARLAPSARLRGNFDSRKNKANTTRNKENYLKRIVSVAPWFAEKPVSQITKVDYKKLIDDLNQNAEMDFISCPANAEVSIMAATAITDLLARAEAEEAKSTAVMMVNKSLSEALKAAAARAEAAAEACRVAAKALRFSVLPELAGEPLTQADLDKMHFERVCIDYGTDEEDRPLVENGVVLYGRLYSIDTLDGAGFEELLLDAVSGETLDHPTGSYTVYRRPLG